MNAAQLASLQRLQDAITDATAVAVFDELAVYIHPDIINAFCDGVDNMVTDAENKKHQ